MSGKRGQKATLLDWANDQNQLDRTAKSTLKELASYADADCCSWAKVSTLAYGVNASERTIQYQLRALQDAGLIRDTGRLHRLEGSTRSVPVYQLAPTVEGLGKPETMGAEIAPIPWHGCKTDGGMGAIGLHPQETIRDQEVAKATSPGVEEREALFVKLEAVTPKRVFAVTDRDEAWVEFIRLGNSGVDLAELIGCMTRMAADPLFLGRKIPWSLENWMAKGRYRTWLPDLQLPFEPAAASEGPAALGAAAEIDQAAWTRTLARLRADLTENTFTSWLKPAFLGQHADQLFVVAATGMAKDWLKSNCLPRLEAAWQRAGGAAGALKLISKVEFEALVKRQMEGVG